MRASTSAKVSLIVDALVKYYQKTSLTKQEVVSFLKSASAPVEQPSAFWHVCRVGDDFDLTRFEQFRRVDSVPMSAPVSIVAEETEEEIEQRINIRFTVMDMMAKAAVEGNCRSMIVSGSAGVGKSHTILQTANTMPEERRSIMTGRVTATGIFRALWKHRFENHVVVFDDADSVFDNDTTMNLLKAACDSSDRRFISMENGVDYFDDDGDKIDNTFEFNGSIIFITNKDFKEECNKGSKMAVHFEAMMSRSHYIDLRIKTEREFMVRIRSVVMKSGMLDDYGDRIRDEILQFIDMNKKNMNELSLRIVKKIGDLTRISPEGWRDMAAVTCMK